MFLFEWREILHQNKKKFSDLKRQLEVQNIENFTSCYVPFTEIKENMFSHTFGVSLHKSIALNSNYLSVEYLSV